MNATGQVSRNSDYLPFGEELGQGNGGAARDTTFSGNGTRQKFTGKERDAESGLDFFEARYFSGPQGRFTSPDPIFASAAHLADPQMWNLYSYARNNPLSITDPTGLDFYLICEHKEENQDICHEVQNDSQRAWVQGTTDSNGTFTPYRIANDANGNLVDINHGNPAFNGSFDQSGVYLSSANAIIVGTGQFINGSNETDVLGSGIFNGLVGRFVSDCGGSCQARGSLYELEPGSGALANAENTLNRRSGFATMIDLLSGAHASGPQWTDAQGRVHVIQNVTGVNAGKTELHFEGHPTGNVTGLALHMLDTIRDAVRGRAAAERNRSLP